MDREQIRSQIKENLAGAGLIAEDIRIQEDPYSGWRVAVISPGFSGLRTEERRTKALSGLDDSVFAWVDLLTPVERELAGDLPANVDVADLPLWAEALAKTEPDQPIVFASDLDKDLALPIVATFYSLRGGVGRSTALAYTAQVLAKRGRSVLCVDLDLEAPGLTALFGKEHEVKPGTGLLSLFLQLDQGESEPDVMQHVIRLSDSEELYCLPAGVPDADYARRLRYIDPESWYREESNPLRKLIDLFPRLPIKPDVVLLDARTGISPISGPLLFDLSDLAIIAFFPHPQTQTGTRALVRAVLSAHSRREDGGRRLTPEPRFLISPIPPRELDRYKRRAEEWVSDWLETSRNARNEDPVTELDEIIHAIPYREAIAASDRTEGDPETLRLYEPVADWIDRFLPSPSENRIPATLAKEKMQILTELEFATGRAEDQADFLKTFVRTEMVTRALTVSKPLILGRKGTGKTALFRWLLEADEDEHWLDSVVVTCPSDFRKTYPWVLSSDGFNMIDEELQKANVGWREFWMVYTALASDQTLRHCGRIPPKPQNALYEALKGVLEGQLPSELAYVSCLSQALQLKSVGLLAWDWLRLLDQELDDRMFLLFDGLDTGFGSDTAARERRRAALEGLFSFMLDRGAEMDKLKFKVLLREDIWKRLRFENKSHFYGRSLTLEWRNQSDYARTVLKQALQNAPLRNLVRNSFGPARLLDVDFQPEEVVLQLWNLLVGERMKGGKTARTLTWVWNRLADGNGDHTPRFLFQLFREATQWERGEHPVVPYDRSVIRPRALISSLDQVSSHALDALLEEFRELGELADFLRVLGRSPVEAALLEKYSEEVALALEVGFLEVYEGTEEEVRRYKVPDLYRVALGMTRKGQA